MKKVLTLLTLLCMVCTGAWANDYQPANGQFIKLHHANTDANWYIGSNELGTSWQKYNSAPTDASDVWQLVMTATEGQFFLFHPYTQTYLGKTDAVGDNQNIPMVQTIEDAGQYKFIAGESTIGSKSYDAFYVRNVLHNNNARNGLHSTSNVTFVHWESQNRCENSLWLPEVVEDPSTILLNNYKSVRTDFLNKCNGHTDNAGQIGYVTTEAKALYDEYTGNEPTTYNATKFFALKSVNSNNIVTLPSLNAMYYVSNYHATRNDARYLDVTAEGALSLNASKTPQSVWKVVAVNQNAGTIQLQSVYNNQKYLNHSSGNLQTAATAFSFACGRSWALSAGCLNLCATSSSNRNISAAHDGTTTFGYGSDDATFDLTNSPYHSTNWKFEVADIAQTVTYTFPTADGAGTFDVSIDLLNNADASANIPSIEYFVATGLAGDNHTVAANNKDFTVQGTWNFPLPFNRVMRLHGDNHTSWIVYESDSKAKYANIADGFRKDCYWYFTYAGMTSDYKVQVYLHNLVNGKKATLANTNDNTQVSFGDGTAFVYRANPKNDDNGFALAHPNNLNDCLNQRDGVLKTWNNSGSPTCDGSRFHIKTDVFDTDLSSVNTIGVAGSKFLGEAAFTVNSAKKLVALAKPTPENVNALYAVNFADVVDLNKYYRFKCQDTGRSNNYVYSDIHANTNGDVNDTGADHRLVKSEAETTVVNTLFKFEKEGNAYYIQHVNSGKYFSKSTADLDLPFYKSSATTYEPTQVDGKWWGIKQTGGSHIHQSNQAHKKLIVWGGLNAEPASNWTIEEVDEIPLTIKTSKWASVCYPVAVTLPDGLTAYYAVKASTDGIGLDALKSNVIPANTPVIVTTSEELSDAKVYNLTIGGEATAPEDNLFTGTTIVRQGYDHANAFNYGLSDGKFVRMTGTTVAANKAFIHANENLAPTNGSSVRVYIFEDTLTGINAATTTAEQGAYYDLNGHFVAYPTTGVYVRNGKKIFVK